MTTLYMEVVQKEYPPDKDGHIYLNTGCCGRKPQSVLDALARAYKKINTKPCDFTFNGISALDQAQEALSRLFVQLGYLNIDPDQGMPV